MTVLSPNDYFSGNDKGEITPEELTLPNHTQMHKDLSVYTELMHWSKTMDRKAYIALKKVYTDSIGKLYDRDLKLFFEQALHIVMGDELTRNKAQNVKPSSSLALLGIDREQWPLEADASDRQRYESTLERVLTQLEPVCLNEQQFCVSFFQLDVVSPSGKVCFGFFG